VSVDGVPQVAIVNAIETVKAKDDKRIVEHGVGHIIAAPRRI
jgi:hypothetical protein